MKKKILIMAAAAFMAVTLSGCTGTTVDLPTLSQAESSAVSGEETSAVETEPVADTDFSDDLEGLCLYMEANDLITSERTDNSFAEMAFQEIGAIGGYRYRFMLGGVTLQVEFYEFSESPDEKGLEVLNSVKEKGEFDLLGNAVPAVLSDNGRFLMIYTDASDDELNVAHRAKAEEMFKAFKA